MLIKLLFYRLDFTAANTNDTLQNLIFKMNGLDLDYEMKIPVAVPAKATSSLSKD